MPHYKKILAACLPALLLAGCVHQPDAAVTWQSTLPGTGAEVTVNGAPVTEDTVPLYTVEGTLLTDTALHLTAADRVKVTVSGLGEGGGSLLDFAQDREGGVTFYSRTDPVPHVDYFSATPESGVTAYQLDTYYDYIVTVTNAAGTDYLVVSCPEPAKK